MCKDLLACFVDLEKSYDRLFNFERFCRRMALMFSCYSPLNHSMVPTGVLWWGEWQAIKGFHVGFELWQEFVLFSLFIVCMNWIDKCSQVDECAIIGNCKLSCLVFDGKYVLLSSTEFDL